MDHVSTLLGHPATPGQPPVTTPTEAGRGFTRQEYSDRVLRCFIDHPDYRLGQAAFNVALSIWPGIVRPLVGTPADPFYDDSRLGAFIEAIFDGEDS